MGAALVWQVVGIAGMDAGKSGDSITTCTAYGDLTVRDAQLAEHIGRLSDITSSSARSTPRNATGCDERLEAEHARSSTS